MTNPKWLIGIATAFVAMSLLCGLLEGSYLVGAGGIGVALRLQTLITFPWPPLEFIPWLKNFWGILTFDYSFFYGGWLIIKYALFWPISLGLIVSYVALIIPYIVTGLQSLFSWVGGRI